MTGKLAISKSGHDAGRIYVIIKEEERDVWIANGDHRPVERPKRKNKKHVQVIKRLPEEVEALLYVDSQVGNFSCRETEHAQPPENQIKESLSSQGFRNEEIKRAIKIYKEFK